MSADGHRHAVSSGLALSHQGFAPASLPGSAPAPTSAAAIAGRRRAGGQSRLFDPSRRRAGARPASAPEGARSAGNGGLTLEQRLTGVWEGLAVAGSAACPLCGAEMRREPGRAEGSCGDCGSTLA